MATILLNGTVLIATASLLLLQSMVLQASAEPADRQLQPNSGIRWG
jgi:hypothetical protein